MRTNLLSYLRAPVGLMLLCATTASAQQPIVKIDLNMLNRPAAEVQYDYPNPTHSHWVVTHPLSDTLVANGITFIVKKGPRGVSLSPTYYKASVQAGAYEAKFTNDGIFVKDGDFAAGASIDLIIKGLPAGTHNLTVFHNATDALTPENVCPIDVYVNDVLKINNLVPTIRREKITEVATSELEINAVEGQDVVVSFKAETSGSQPVKNVYINGIYLNAVNVGKKARAIDPVNQSLHLDIPIGNGYTLKWERSPAALSHDIYFGTDSAGVANADKNSSYYKGNKVATDTTYTVSNLYSMESYFWRIDEVHSGQTYKGDVWMFRTRQLAFPGAEGFGQFARGGRGGKVVYVTNLNDSGPGSLREAVTNNIGPRTILFKVGGVIELQSRLVLSDRYVTIAGQTAPGKGICIRKNPFGIGADDAILRNVRLRLGAGPTADGMGMNGNNSIMDHCSISWTIDEAFSSRGAKNITLQRTLISEALNVAGHQNYPAGTAHGYAATIGGNKGSFHHNLLAHCYGRNWSLGGGLDANGYFASQMDIRNNVVYNWGTRATDGGAHEVNFVNNYYKAGPGTTLFYALTANYENIGMGTQKYYFAGNVIPGHFDENNQNAGKRVVYSNGQAPLTYDPWVSIPFFDAPVTTQTAYHAYKMVLSDVGANQPFFDLHDIRMINETLNGTYSVTGSVSGKKGFPDTEVDAGGYENYPAVSRTDDWDSDLDGLPDWWEKIKGTNLNSAPGDFSDANEDNDRDGFTNLDYYLQFMAEPHYFPASGQATSVNLKDLAMGFSKSPAFSIANIVNGTAGTISNGVVEFTPNANALASFEFTVTDSEGHSMTRKVNVAGGVQVTLPVTLTTFNVERENEKQVVLKWKTVQENNNSHFEILRSDDGEKFRNLGVKISTKAPSGTGSFTLHYDFTDANSNINDTYYQLLQKDKDGKENYSSVKVVKGNPVQINVWPVPSDREVYVSVGRLSELSELAVYDLVGKQVLKRTVEIGQTQKITLETKGVYIMKIRSKVNQQELGVKKIVIQ